MVILILVNWHPIVMLRRPLMEPSDSGNITLPILYLVPLLCFSYVRRYGRQVPCFFFQFNQNCHIGSVLTNNTDPFVVFTIVLCIVNVVYHL